MKKEMRNLSGAVTAILNQENPPKPFISNLEQIIQNPESVYNEKVSLFKEIPALEGRQIDLNDKVAKLSEIEVELGNSVKSLSENLANLASERDVLSEEIEKLNILKVANTDQQKELKERLDKELEEKRVEIDEAKKKIKEEYKSQATEWKEKIRILKKKFSTAEDLSAIKSEAKEQKKFYYSVIVLVALFLLSGSCVAIKMGQDVISQYVSKPEAISYFGLFLLKIPYSLIELGIITGSVILLTKLLVLIEKINNQLRNISQILAIAKTIEDKALDPFFEGSKIVAEEAKKEDLKYKLISDYLDRLGKRELEEKTENKFDQALKLVQKLHKMMPESGNKKVTSDQ